MLGVHKALEFTSLNAPKLKADVRNKKMLIAETKIHLVACKAKDYRQRVLMIYEALAQFLTEQHFSTQDLHARFTASPSNFQIHTDDLTEPGLAWVKSHLDRWMRNLDRRKKPMEYEDYLASLAKTVK